MSDHEVPQTTTVSFEEFDKVELRVGEVLSAAAIPKSDKLLKLSVDFGEGSPRNVVAGIHTSRDPQSLLNKKFVFATNLPPAKIRGEVSTAMILAAKDDAGGFALATVDLDSIKPGSILG